MNQYDISCIVPLFFSKSANDDRRKNIKFFLWWINDYLKLTDMEIIICEQYENEPSNLDIFHKYSNIRYETIQKNLDSMYYGWMMNYTARFSKRKILLFADCDGICDITKAFSIMDQYDAISPFKQIYYSTKKESEIFEGNPDLGSLSRMIKLEILKSQNLTVDYIGGLTFFIHRDKFFDISGFNESVIGWGPAGEMIGLKIKNILNGIILPNQSFHLHHTTEMNYGDVYLKQRYMRRSLKEFEEMKNLSTAQLLESINRSKNTIGLL